ncbi:glycosyltransferase family 9 protein [Desulfobaculum bizertense]|uniref:ADP-heptose:LPS heptosyltransferase n=1 Tax=Desulfobaculum bizertense DSM 18034 TaxID=1121442 RepID=A0A1T4W2M7_9BACT|nr:glycosyltransferase family 9 protein [Desulfobaculum bizertense]SKA71554.1 ADP-heptose:LPS heptosyltransferase [Desulfobaculum bizertense DSM 18034]
MSTESDTGLCGPKLVVQLARFGDLVQTKRLILSLVRQSESAVHLVVDHSLVTLAKCIYPDIIVHGVHAHARPGVTEQDILRQNLAVFHELKECQFSEVYNLNFSGLNMALSTLFDPDTVRGHRMEQGQERSDLWSQMGMRWVRLRRDVGMNLVDFWACLADDPIAPGEVNPIAMRGGKGIGVVMAGRESRRSIPPETLAAIAGATTQGTRSDTIFLIGSSSESGRARAFLDAAPRKIRENTTDLTGKTDWAGLIDALTGLDALITPDTGTMHLAAHLGVPVHALFLSSAWCHETGPYGIGHRVWQSAEPCAPCLESAPCRKGVKCLNAFSGRNFLRHLAGNAAFEVPEGMLGYVSAIDSLGVTYRPVLGQDPTEASRASFRALIGQYKGYAMWDKPVDERMVRTIFHEQDWIFGGDMTPQDIREMVPAPELDEQAAE